jgi:HlyD family secretion protein
MTRSEPGARQREVLAVLERGRGRRKVYGWGAVVLALAVVAGGLFFWQRRASEPMPVQWKTTEIRRGMLHETVTASGTLNPVDAVELGAEVSGKVTVVTVDVNDPVTVGQVLAEIDPDQLKARVQESRASLSSALASRDSAKASLAESELTEKRLRALFDRGLASSQELENAEASAARAKASVASAQAQITVAQAGLLSAQTSLGKAVIVAPIDGIVLARSVEPGQTLTAGFQTPVMFTLGRDLSQLELTVEVDEADIGKVSEGQSAWFTVDAFPNRRFDAKLTKLYSLPTKSTGTTTTTVVTYSALLTVDNAARLLRPGMTATATITTRTLENVSLVPNVALRFQPPREDSSRRFFPFFGGPGAPPKRLQEEGPALPKNAERIWVPAGLAPRSIGVEVLGTDGIDSAIRPLDGSADAELGAQAIVDVALEPPR